MHVIHMKPKSLSSVDRDVSSSFEEATLSGDSSYLMHRIVSMHFGRH